MSGDVHHWFVSVWPIFVEHVRTIHTANGQISFTEHYKYISKQHSPTYREVIHGKTISKDVDFLYDIHIVTLKLPS